MTIVSALEQPMAKDRHTYSITGGVPLEGSITASGAKNAVTKQLVASLLTDQPCVLHKVPRIVEVDLVLGMLAELGTEVTWLGEHSVRVHTPEVRETSLSAMYSGVNRIPILMMGPLLHRRGETLVPLPGGCTIGKRPIDFHLEGLRQMGADIAEHPTSVKVRVDRLAGAHIDLLFPSVGATENLLLAAVRASGTTVISNAAVEPEIVDLILMLQKMGALITIDTDRTITVEGVRELRGVEHTTIADRIEIASFAGYVLAALVADGTSTITGTRYLERGYEQPVAKLAAVGARITTRPV
ncbi:UDP-N-acetylglucosamine 1-carboxyvinyltransferase [Streptomyces sp. NBC_00569]|uniref:UDP-N-acetylglucosamine 1-carboxyvinyltransferase n=1 Tax=unclassified Streptomyces TaxID=2593676 RepID=UPI0022578EBA|nr:MULTISPECIES: UDP-N-acetylglucosamine 1-carboxyvinyltransferase [unclassified Streptomyces]MCX5443547.1 UDP-N-acetylglucosamine 1-carboxyvinyltransferase [Streptomyces sp. NBC_00063]WUB98940.1 UDP-N-acetylglucosamine 1-carboxyvinyltransferase [Streptomyces sp. NBC_00569]